jgi:uncharacterized protein (DUF2252 family)
MLILQGARSPERDRTDAYAALARRVADGDAVVVHPALLPPYERRLHVRRTLREDHQFRILNRPEGAQSKFDKLADDLYDFFRGTALLYYRDYAGTDGDLPAVVTLGDVHPENFGVMPNEDGAPIFGVNDFDEAAFAPFSYDVKRGSVGFWLACRRNGFKKKVRREVVRAFAGGYLAGLTAFAKDDAEKWHEYRIDNSPDMIRDLLKGATEPRREFLAESVDVEKGRFRSTEEIVPHSKHREAFQEVIDGYVEDNEVEVYGQRDGYFTVCDVAVKKGSGTASLGLDRFWVLVEGPDPDDPAEARILEMKQARPSALRGLVPPQADRDSDSDEAETVVRAQQVHLVGGDPFYGRAEIEDQLFLVRERSPFKDDIDVEDLDEDEMATYADICGRALAQPHARSDEHTGIEADPEQRILETTFPPVFTNDMARFAETAARRVKRDWEAFKEDHDCGAFDFSHVE